MLQALLIFLLQILYVPVSSIRTVLLVKGKTYSATIVGLFEGLIYIVSLGIVFKDLSNIYNIIAYVIGFGAGLLIGGILEEKLAIGYITYQINLLEKCDELVTTLRESGFGVTQFEVEGMNSPRYRLEILAKRSREKQFLQIVEGIAPKAFITTFETRSFKGGFLKNTLKK